MPSDIGCAWTLVIPPTIEPLAVAEAKLQARVTIPDEDSLLASYIVAGRQAAEEELARGLLTQTWKLVLDEFAESIWLPMAAPLQNDAVPVPIVANSVANPTVVTTLMPHGLTSGASVTIAGNVTSSPAINGTQTVTVLSLTSFSVPVNVVTGGTGGTVVRVTPVTAPLVQYYNAVGTLTTLPTTAYLVDTVSRPGRIVRGVGQSWPSLQSDRLSGRVEITYVVGWLANELIPERIKQGIRSYVTYLDCDREGLAEYGELARKAAAACWTDRVYWKPPVCAGV